MFRSFILIFISIMIFFNCGGKDPDKKDNPPEVKIPNSEDKTSSVEKNDNSATSSTNFNNEQADAISKNKTVNSDDKENNTESGKSNLPTKSDKKTEDNKFVNVIVTDKETDQKKSSSDEEILLNPNPVDETEKSVTDEPNTKKQKQNKKTKTTKANNKNANKNNNDENFDVKKKKPKDPRFGLGEVGVANDPLELYKRYAGKAPEGGTNESNPEKKKEERKIYGPKYMNEQDYGNSMSKKNYE